jgi:DNA polymerase I-like protein with 3'-5' exonuclease and polymerase domains
MRIVLDVENSITRRDGELYNDPFEPSNTLTQVGVKSLETGRQMIMTFDHVEHKDTTGKARAQLQYILDKATLLVGHNLQYDLMWLWATGFKYDKDIYDTMLAEYLLLRGQKQPLSLEACALRRKLSYQKDDTLKEYYKKGYNTNEIPLADLTKYLACDLDTTGELYESIEADYAKPDSDSLHKVRAITFATCKTLTRMHMSGFRVDRDALFSVKKQFQDELADIEERLNAQVRQLMGDTPINLNSPEQMSQVVFSRKVKDKKEWADLFNYVETPREFKQTVEANSTVVRKTTASTCPECGGEGKVFKLKKDGTPFKKPTKCPTCQGAGYLLTERPEVAGLKFTAPSKTWVTANGFGTGKDVLTQLIATAKDNKMDSAVSFLTDLKRLSAVSSYLSSFVGGIERYTKQDDYLHVSLTQHVTATGRFSGREPNMQNMPRGGTFPVKRVFVSRWDGGYVLEADFAQLEFRAAAYLAQDTLAMHEIETGFDVHSYTAKVITDAGQTTTRQEAKAHTFAPLFGATGYGRSKAEAAYYEHFVEKYEGIAAWHKKLGDEALRFLKITNVSGRQYAFPDVTRRKNGTPSHFTMIKNYPVQGFATGDVVPVVLVELDRQLAPLQSCLVNSVHDSAVIDVHPDEKDQVLGIIQYVNDNLAKLVETAYGIEVNVPLLLEAKIGPNWLDTKDV